MVDRSKIIKWVKASLLRAIKAMAQTALASIGTASVGMPEFNRAFVLSTTGMAGIISLLMSLEKFPEDTDRTE